MRISKLSIFTILVALVFALGGGFMIANSLATKNAIDPILQLKQEISLAEEKLEREGLTKQEIFDLEEKKKMLSADEEEVGGTATLYQYVETGYNTGSYKNNSGAGYIGVGTSLNNATMYMYDQKYDTGTTSSGTTLYFVASQNSGYRFMNFYKNTSMSSWPDNILSTTVNGGPVWYFYITYGNPYDYQYYAFYGKERGSWTVSYHKNGATSGSAPSSQTKYEGSTLTLRKNTGSLAKTGYTFAGWNTNSSGTGTSYSAGGSYTSNSGVTLYAKWTANTYSVKYNGNGSTSGSMSNSSHTYGSSKALTSNAFSRTGYTFQGWSTSSTATSATYSNGQKVSNLTSTNGGTVNLYAVWKANTYTVTLDSQSATSAGTTSVTATYGSAMPSITKPTKTGYTFGGYYTSTGGGGTQYYTAAGASARNWDKTAATTLYAKWTANTYTVTLDNQSATSAGTTSVTATYASAMPAITKPSKTGYTFGGYYTSTDGGGTQYYTDAGASARSWDKTSATTLYAKWTGITFTVVFNANGGSGTMSNQSFTYGTAQALTANTFTRTGYSFGGWATSAGGSKAYDDKQSVSNLTSTSGEKVNLYAVWTAYTYTIAYNGNGNTSGSTASSTHTYGVAKALTSNGFVREYVVTYNLNYDGAENQTATATYTFKNWTANADGTGNSYTNGQQVTSLTSTNGATVNLYAQWNSGSVTLANPTRANYNFMGWALTSDATEADYEANASYTPTENKTLYAVWAMAATTIVFNINGGNPAGQHENVLAFKGEPMPSLEGIPTRDGFIFAGYSYKGMNYYDANLLNIKNWNIAAIQATLFAQWVPSAVAQASNEQEVEEVAIPQEVVEEVGEVVVTKTEITNIITSIVEEIKAVEEVTEIEPIIEEIQSQIEELVPNSNIVLIEDDEEQEQPATKFVVCENYSGREFKLALPIYNLIMFDKNLIKNYYEQTGN